MRLDQATHQDEATTTAASEAGDTVVAAPSPAPMVGPLGGIVFSALCLASYVGVIAAVAIS